MAQRTRDEVWEQRTGWLLALVALTYLAMYSVHVLARPHGVEPRIVLAATWFTWGLFVVDYLVRLALAPDKLHWFVHHLFDVVIVALPLMGPLRLLRAVVAFGALQKAVGNAVRGRILLYTLTGATLLIYVGSLAVLAQERDHPGANITSFGKALWWAISTVTTVGYGDVYPITVAGRVIAGLLMVGGITWIGVVTGSLASWIVQAVSDAQTARHEASAASIDELRTEMSGLAEELRQACAALTAAQQADGADTNRDAESRVFGSPPRGYAAPAG